MKKELNIAHISPDEFEKSSSFIQANIMGLEGNVFPYFGGYMPRYFGKHEELSLGLLDRIVFKVKGNIRGLSRNEYALYKSLKENEVDLIFAEYGPTASAVYRVAKALKIPLLVHFHGYDVYHQPTVSKQKKHYQKIIAQGATAIAVSKEMRQTLISWGFDADDVVYSPCGCHTKFLELSLPSERNGFVAVGRMVDKKAPLLTIQAFHRALKEGLKDTLTFIGDGPLMPVCKQYVDENELQKNVVFLGYQSHEVVLQAMLQAKVFLQHSVTSQEGDREGTPVSIVEAMAVGMPVISTVHAGIQDVVRHGVDGFLVSEGDVESMADFILRLAKDAAGCERMGKEGRAVVRSHYTDKIHLQTINDFILKRNNG
ncbi:MAG: glycosyltransferase [Bacteroidetes bacterium]|nr:glycosyltransferase [Bacteroidota bacterium]